MGARSTEGEVGVVSGFGDGLRAHRGAGLDADDPDFAGQRRPELPGEDPGAGTDIDDQIGGMRLGDNGGKVRNQLIGVAWPVLAILLGEPVVAPRIVRDAASLSSRRS
jgi:hypothetical protein